MSSVRRVPVPEGYAAWPPAATWDEAWWAAWLRGRGWADSAIGQYLARRRGLSLSVTRGKGKGATTHVLYAPTPKGVEFHLCPSPNLLYGGAAGGSKSYTARWDAYLRMFTTPGGRYLMLRRKYTELIDNHINDAQREVERMRALGLPIEYYKDDKRVVVSHPGQADSWLRFGHCQNEGDEEAYLSSDYEGVYPDETATFTKKQVMGVASRLRSPLPGVMPVLRCTSNPGGSQTLWLKDYFIDRAVAEEEDEGYVPSEYAFLDAKLYDNPYLMDPDGTWTRYERRLKALGPERAAQMLEGSWDVISGQFFTEFSRQTHARDVAVPKDCGWFRCLDWGYNARGVCLWVACLPDGRLHVAHEYVFRQTIAADVAGEIVRQTQDLRKVYGGCEVRYTVADPSMWNHSGQSGESIAETFARHKVPLKKGSNERVIGWQRLRHWLLQAPDGLPWMTIQARDGVCAAPYLLRTLPALVADETTPEDVDTTGEDHAADALRYGVMSRPAPMTSAAVRVAPPPGSVGALIAAARAEASQRTRLGARAVRARRAA